MNHPVVSKIAALLTDQALERRMAAAIVLGALEVKEPAIVDALVGLLDSDIAPLQRHALDALASAKPKKALSRILALLSSRDDEVRAAAVRALVEMGDAVVPALREKLAVAPPGEKRALEEVLAKVGGKEAFSALLSGLEAAADAEQAKAAAIALRSRIKEADARERRTYLSHLEKFLEKGTAKKGAATSPHALVGALKILGYLEDESAVPTLLAFATSSKQPDAVRNEAIIALRFAAGDQAGGKKLAGKLLDLAEAAPPAVARTALYTLAAIELPSAIAPRLGKLAADPDPEKARLAIERLAPMKGTEAAEALADVLLRTKDRARAELALAALSGREDGAPAVAGSLVEARDPDRAWMLAKIVKPWAKKLEKKTARALVESAVARLVAAERGWEAQLHVAREADPAATTEALRAAGDKLRKAGKVERALAVFRQVGRTEGATLEDQYVLASLELRSGRRDLDVDAREGNEGLKLCTTLADRGFDLAAALRKDRALDLEDRYYVGFHLVEKGLPAGSDVLSDVADAGGRSAIAKKAKSKLKSAKVG